MVNLKKLRGAVADATRRADYAIGMFAHADRELKEANMVLSEAVANYDAMIRDMMAEAGILRSNIKENERVRGQIQAIYMPDQCDGTAPKIPHPEEQQEG